MKTNTVRRGMNACALLAVAVLALGSARADLVFSETFNSALADGTVVTGTPSGNTSFSIFKTLTGTQGNSMLISNPSPLNSGAAIRIVTSTTNPGVGSGNVQSIGANGLASIPVGTLRLSIYTPSAWSGVNSLTISSGTGTTYNSSFNGVWNSANAAASTFGLRISDSGTLQLNNTTNNTFVDQGYTFINDNSYTFIINFNASASEVVYAGGTMAPGTGDIRINGTLVADDFALRNASLASKAFAIRGLGGLNNTEAYTIDDIFFYDAAIIPEPSSLALGAFGGLTLLGLYRRHRRSRQIQARPRGQGESELSGQ